MTIIVFGGNGLLGKELQKQNGKMFCPPSNTVNIENKDEVKEFIDIYKPDIVINAAAVLDNRILEKTPEKAISTNIIGAANVANVCIDNNIRYIYISTDYIYKGDRGNYKEEDEILPFNFYAWTKLGGECSAKGVKNHLIIRVSFGKSEFSYPISFIDKWSSKDYVDKIAPMIYEAAISPLTGILNLGTERKTLFDYAKLRNSNVQPVRLSDTSFSTPYDTSLNLQKWLNYKSIKPVCKSHNKCRACGSDKLIKYLDLGLLPLPNNLGNTSLEAKSLDKYPLQVLFCQNCSLSQLSTVINPDVMYSYYTYRSGINTPYIAHCRQMAKKLKETYNLDEESFHIDIAGNDGTLLKEFKKEIGLKVLNIDPAENLVAISEAQGIPALCEFWDTWITQDILEKYPLANLITATNVFAHVNDIQNFLQACQLVLAPNGLIVIECPYIENFIEEKDFGQIYHEHLSYMSIGPLNTLCQQLGLKIINLQKQDIHGGTMRYYISHHSSKYVADEIVYNSLIWEKQKQYNNLQIYKSWSEDIMDLISNFSINILELKKQGFKIGGFAASAKGTILLNSAGINTDIMEYICDDTPEKIGRYSPGSGIPIVQKQQLVKNPVDYLLILSWNFKDKLMEVAREVGFKGKFIIPIPTWQVID